MLAGLVTAGSGEQRRRRILSPVLVSMLAAAVALEERQDQDTIYLQQVAFVLTLSTMYCTVLYINGDRCMLSN